MLVYPCPIYDAAIALMGLLQRMQPKQLKRDSQWLAEFATIRVKGTRQSGHTTAALRLLAANDGGLYIAPAGSASRVAATTTVPRVVYLNSDRFGPGKNPTRSMVFFLVVIDQASMLTAEELDWIYAELVEVFSHVLNPMIVLLG